jgi:DNA-directed RNA polymerase subunit omega
LTVARLACVPTTLNEVNRVSSPTGATEGIIYPPIDELLKRTQSKYALVIIAAKRARQINAYYSQLGEGLLEYVGPLVDTAPQEKPLSIALREINADLVEFRPSKEADPDGESEAGADDLGTES